MEIGKNICDGQIYPQIIEYRNASYQGSYTNQNRTGFGILITDFSQIIISFWLKNKIQGPYIHIGNKINSYGFMKSGKLFRFNVIEYEKYTIYGYFKENLMHGKVLFRYVDYLCLYDFDHGRKIQQISKSDFSNQLFLQLINEHFKKEIIGLSSYLSLITKSKDVLQCSFFKQILKQSHYKYYGFTNIKNRPNGLGLTLKNDKLYSCGQFQDFNIKGLGRIFQKNNEIIDGEFSLKSLLRGIKYQKQEDKFCTLIGNNRIDNSGRGFPFKQILKFRKEYHLKSVNFINQNIVIKLLLKIQLASLLENFEEFQQFQERNSIYNQINFTKKPINKQFSTKKIQVLKQNSPLKIKLKKLEIESEKTLNSSLKIQSNIKQNIISQQKNYQNQKLSNLLNHRQKSTKYLKEQKINNAYKFQKYQEDYTLIRLRKQSLLGYSQYSQQTRLFSPTEKEKTKSIKGDTNNFKTKSLYIYEENYAETSNKLFKDNQSLFSKKNGNQKQNMSIRNVKKEKQKIIVKKQKEMQNPKQSKRKLTITIEAEPEEKKDRLNLEKQFQQNKLFQRK